MIRRVGWGLADQALSSLQNFALGIILARSVGVAEFGAFSIAFASYAVALGISRGFSTQPLTVRFSGLPVSEWRMATAASSGMALLVGVVSLLVSLLLAALFDAPLRVAFLAIAVVLPGLLLQDSWRFALFAAGRGRDAFLNDLVWAVVMAGLVAVSVTLAYGSLAGPILAWGAAAAVAAIFGLIQTGTVPKPRSARRWFDTHRGLSIPFVGEFLTSMAATQGSLFVLGALGGLGEAGALRAAQLVLGPLNILFQGIGLVAVPEGVRLYRRSAALLRRMGVLLSATLFAAALVWGIGISLLPASLGTQLLGATWPVAQPLLVPLAIGLAMQGVQSGAYVILRSLAAARRSFRVNLVTSSISFAGGTAGAILADASGVAWAQAGTGTISAALWWRQALAAIRHDSVNTAVQSSQPARESPTPPESPSSERAGS